MRADYQALAQELEQGGVVWRVTWLEGDTVGQTTQSVQPPAWLEHGFCPPGQTVPSICKQGGRGDAGND